LICATFESITDYFITPIFGTTDVDGRCCCDWLCAELRPWATDNYLTTVSRVLVDEFSSAGGLVLDSDAIDAFQSYCRVGEVLRTDESIRGGPLQNLVSRLSRVKVRPSPFGVLDGPSGIGKSQQFFALSDARVIFFAVVGWSDVVGTQPIYRAFDRLSASFKAAVNADLVSGPLASMRAHLEKNTFAFLNFRDVADQRFQLRTAGFLLAVLKRFSVMDCDKVLKEQVFGEPLVYKRATLNDVSDYLDTDRELFSSFVFGIDEFPPSEGDGKVFNTFARNIFRFLMLTVVLSGTDSTFKNALGGSSSSSASPDLWAVAIAEMPNASSKTIGAALKVDPETLDEHSWKNLMISSRPRLAVDLAKTMVDRSCPDLDDAIDFVACRLFSWKGPSLRSGIGQWQSFEPTGVILPDITETMASRLIIEHMAIVYFVPAVAEPGGQSLFLHRIADFVVNSKSELQMVTERHDSGTYFSVPFKQRSGYPSVAVEPLLYLVLHGTRSTPAFALHNQRISVLRWRINATFRENAPFDASTEFDDASCTALLRDGNKLEAIGLVAASVASRNNGVRGSSADDFTSGFCRELAADETYSADLKCSPPLSAFSSELASFSVPYLFPAGPEGHGVCGVPASISGLGLFGQLYRPPNKAMIDMRCLLPQDLHGKPKILLPTGEFKNRKDELRADLLGECMKRIPEQSRLHFIVCDRISPGLFSKRTETEFVVYSDAQREAGKTGKSHNPTVKKQCKILIARRSDDGKSIHLDFISESFESAWRAQPLVRVDTVVIIVSPQFVSLPKHEHIASKVLE